MTTKFNLVRDINGFNGFGVAFSDALYDTTLAIGVAQSLTVPVSMGMGGNGLYSGPEYIAIFSFQPGSNVWVADNFTATVPGASFAATNSELNPAARLVKGGDVLSFITGDSTALVGVAFYVLS